MLRYKLVKFAFSPDEYIAEQFSRSQNIEHQHTHLLQCLNMGSPSLYRERNSNAAPIRFCLCLSNNCFDPHGEYTQFSTYWVPELLTSVLTIIFEERTNAGDRIACSSCTQSPNLREIVYFFTSIRKITNPLPYVLIAHRFPIINTQ